MDRTELVSFIRQRGMAVAAEPTGQPRTTDREPPTMTANRTACGHFACWETTSELGGIACPVSPAR